MKMEQVQIQEQEKDDTDRLWQLRETATNFLRDTNAHSPDGAEPNARDAFLIELARDIVAVYGETD